MAANPIDGFWWPPATISYVGDGLERPECVLAERDGSLWTPTRAAAWSTSRPDGSQP